MRARLGRTGIWSAVVRFTAVVATAGLAATGSVVVTGEPASAHHGLGHTVYSCNDIALWSEANRLWVSAEVGYPSDQAGMLRARNTTIGPWEQFRICRVSDNAYDDGFALWSYGANGWVSAEIGYPWEGLTGMLRARPDSDLVETWEEYRIIQLGGDPRHIALLSAANNDVVSVELSYPTNHSFYGMLRARTNVIGPWESLYFVYL